MNTTTESRRSRFRRGTEQPVSAPSTERLAPPPKLRRRPILVVAAVAAICLGSLASLWAYQSAATSQSVIAMRTTVERGDLVTREALMSVQISVDPALQPIAAADALRLVIGKRAALDMPAGAIITTEQVTDEVIPTRGNSVVGISLPPGMLPTDQLRVGDHVRVVTTPGRTGDVAETDPVSVAAVVVAVRNEAST